MTAYSNVNKAKVNDYLVYICGVEVPVLSVSLSSSVWAIPTANIQMPADRNLKRLGAEDRVRVTIFYLDTVYYDGEYCLIFDGEIVSIGYSSSARAANLSLTCRGLASAFESLKMFFLSSMPNFVKAATGNPDADAVVAGASYAKLFPASLFYSNLSSADNAPILRPYDFVENVFKMMAGLEAAPPALVDALQKSYKDGATPSDTKSVIATHWFNRWLHRTNFMDQWLPLPGYETFFTDKDSLFPVLRTIQQSSAIDALVKMASNIGDSGSVWELLRQVFVTLYYEVSILLTPPALAVKAKSLKVRGGFETKIGNDQLRLGTHVTKPQMLFGVPPACNVIWKSLVISLSYSEDYASQPTRLRASAGQHMNTYAPDGSRRAPGAQELINREMSVAFPPIAQYQLDQRIGREEKDGDFSRNPHNFLVWPEEFFKGPVTSHRQIPRWFQYLANAQAEPSSIGIEADFSTPRAFMITLSGRLTAELQKPGVLSTFSNSTAEDFIKSVFNLPGKVRSMGSPTEDASPLDKDLPTLKNAYISILEQARVFGEDFAPSVKIDELISSIDASTVVKKVIVNDKGETDVVEENSNKANLEVFKLYAAYEYYRERFSRRNGSATMVFNPYIAAGYPGVLFDKDVLQYHQFTYIVSVSHTLTPSGFTTSVTYSYARTFNEFFQELMELRNPKMFSRVDVTGDKGQDSIRIEEELAEKGGVPTKQGRTTSAPIDIDGSGGQSVQKDTRRISDFLLDPSILEEGPLDSGPANPIESYRVGFQRNAGARGIYQGLFWRNEPRTNKYDTVFNWSDTLVSTRNGSPRAKITLDNPDDVNYTDSNTEFHPSPAYQEVNNSTSSALEYCARPVCTLDEWLIHNARVAVKKEDRTVENRGHLREYYVMILSLEMGPGLEPEQTELGNRKEEVTADTRYAWVRSLLDYRNRIYDEGAPLST